MRCGALFSNVVVCIFILYVCLCSFQLFQLFFPSGSFTVESDSLPLSLLSPNAKKIEQLFQRQDITPLCENSVHVNETARLALYLAYTNNIDCSKAFISLTAGKPFTSRFSCLSIWNTTIHYDPVQKKLAEADIRLGWKLLRSDRTIYVHALFDFEDSKSQRHAVRQFSRDITPLRNLVNLLEASEEENISVEPSKAVVGIPHTLDISLVVDQLLYVISDMPPDLRYFYGQLEPTSRKSNLKAAYHYSPLAMIQQFWLTNEDYVAFPMDQGKKSVNVNDTLEAPTSHQLHIQVSSIHVGLFRLFFQLEAGMEEMRSSLGFTEKDLDAVRDLFKRNSPEVLLTIVSVSLVHILFDFLAFKNDISHWKNRKSLTGVSTRTVIFNAVFQIIVFLYLHDNDTSLLVLIPSGIQCVICIWKLKRALRVSFKCYGIIPVGYSVAKIPDDEVQTNLADARATKWMSYVLYPLLLGYAIYSLVYERHLSWYSWILNTLSGFVYVFGFIMMTPQLFVNYRLKSVAHLPWRALMYKSFNTFIDDVFAFIIKMPTLHRVACFRDDLVFLVFLYQRWIYPVDYKRVNEFGQSFEEDDKQKTE